MLHIHLSSGAGTTGSFEVGHLTMLSVWRLYSVDYRVINECGSVGGMKIGREN
jgi:hypothetical protein